MTETDEIENIGGLFRNISNYDVIIILCNIVCSYINIIILYSFCYLTNTYC